MTQAPKFEITALGKTDRGLLEAGIAVAKSQHCTVRITTAHGTSILVSPKQKTQSEEPTQ